MLGRLHINIHCEYHRLLQGNLIVTAFRSCVTHLVRRGSLASHFLRTGRGALVDPK